MIAIIKTIDGIKRIIKVTADVGAGNPVGSFVAMYKKSNPQGYLYCDGSTFDQNTYPLLYAYLGTNVLPDYRECAIVGAEQNTTETIANHDVFTQGEFKDDQLQFHAHRTYVNGDSQFPFNVTAGLAGAGGTWGSGSQYPVVALGNYGNAARMGNTTRGKRKAVYFYIKATSGLSENAQDNVVAQLNEQNSYFTMEHVTGKKWIDGKPIYKKVFVLNTAVSLNAGSWATINDIDVSTFGAIVDATMLDSINFAFEGFYLNKTNDNKLRILTPQSYEVKTIILEYTKTAD